ncbi:MAG: ribonuclease HI [Alphaproteobacteria bacterium]|nr:ribonuclease HI [Alphaproteobacteria bacterium]
MTKKKYYAYSINGKEGIADDWPRCQKLVSGMVNARYKGFETKGEAERWLKAGADYGVKHIAGEKGIYFDAGTGAGKGVEISVTDENGNGLLDKVLKKKEINHRGNHWILNGSTNNFGELLACKYALEIALKKKIKKVFGDSKLILDYWSKGYIKKTTNGETVDLSNEVKKLRYEFEKKGGEMKHISGGSNPADLGFHKD